MLHECLVAYNIFRFLLKSTIQSSFLLLSSFISPTSLSLSLSQIYPTKKSLTPLFFSHSLTRKNASVFFTKSIEAFSKTQIVNFTLFYFLCKREERSHKNKNHIFLPTHYFNSLHFSC